jgi:spermidine/putrescine-binding protein
LYPRIWPAAGVKKQKENFDYDETMLTKLETAKGGGYDLIIADDYIIETVIAKGLAQKLDKSRLSNYRNINPIYQKQFYDPADEYTVPYGAGVQTIVYDPRRGADCFEYLGYYSTYAASDSRISAEYRQFLTLPEGFNVNMEMIGNVSPEAEEVHNLIWTAFKTAAGR